MLKITLLTLLTTFLGVIPGGKAYMKQLQPRDSILIADQIEYGIQLENVKEGTGIALPDLSEASNDTLALVRGWQLDTLKTKGRKKDTSSRLHDIKASIILAPFEEGTYKLPDIPLQRDENGKIDTLLFEGMEMDVRTMPVDTATFEINDIKGQMTYPLTFAEIAPWLAGGWLFAALAILAVCLVMMRRSTGNEEIKSLEPAYIVALRKLDKYRGDKFWAPEKQKAFYSGITDTLKFYIEDRFGVNAPEMTTAELFDALKGEKNLPPELYADAKELFERADFVKFAKYTATDEENAKALPLAVRFVTSTYQTELEEEQKENVL